MATLRYQLLGRRKDGSSSVAVILTHHSVRRRIQTNIIVGPGDYSKKTGRITDFEKLRKVEDVINNCREVLARIARERVGQKYSVDYIMRELSFNHAEDEHPDFFSFADSWLAESTLRDITGYTCMLNRLAEYVGERRLAFDDMTYTFLEGFERTLSGPRAPSKYMGCIRHLYREAMKRFNDSRKVLIKDDPFTRYQVPRMRTNTGGLRALTLDELLRIYEYKADDPDGRAQLARDCFILSFCLMGMNTADMYSADRAVRGVLSYNRMKTRTRREDGAYIEIDINPLISDLCSRYSDKSRKKQFNFYRRYCCYATFNQNVNKGLKVVGEAIGIPNLTFYQARHTFATLSRNLMGFSKSDVDEALNHVGDYSVADIYIRKNFRIINENNRKLLERVFVLLRK